MERTLLVLAAGAGSRYGGLKQLEAIGPGGEALLEYSVYDALAAGFSRVVLVIRRADRALFGERLEAGMGRQVSLRFVFQDAPGPSAASTPEPRRVKPWGTGHAVLAAEAEIRGPFAVVNADDFYGAASFGLLAQFLRRSGTVSPPTLAMVAFEVARTLTEAGPVSRALCELDEAGFLDDIVELKEVWRDNGRVVYRDAAGAESALDGGELVSMNMWGFTPELFPELRRRFQAFLEVRGGDLEAEFLLPDVVRSLVREGSARVEVLEGAGEWCGITFRDDRRRAAARILSLVERGSYPKELWA